MSFTDGGVGKTKTTKQYKTKQAHDFRKLLQIGISGFALGKEQKEKKTHHEP